MEPPVIQVDLGDRSYPIVVTSNELDRIGEFARSRTSGWQALLVADSHTGPCYADTVRSSLERAGFQVLSATVQAGESSKSPESAESLYQTLCAAKAERSTVVVAVGGGVVGDLAGFVAATYARGIPFIQVPTSLLAQVDSSVGGKVGINFGMPQGRIVKNIIGAFHQPIGVFVDTETLRTLPPRELRAGLAEVVKYGVILDAELFGFLESNGSSILALDPGPARHIVSRSCELKAGVVADDERELTDRRAILNYGHTFAHAIEAVTRNYCHGEAVAIGMVAASRLAERLGLVSSAVTQRQRELLHSFELPTQASGLEVTSLIDAMRSDKKAKSGRLRFVLPRGIGTVELVDGIDEDLVRGAVIEMVEAATT